MNEENQRVRDYLIAQAGSKPIETLIERVREGVAGLEAAARAIPAERLRDVPPGESWSPMACLQHVIGWNIGNATQILHAAWGSEVPPREEPQVPDDLDAALASQAEALDSLFIHVSEADPDGFLDVRWEHEMFGDLNWREWLLFLRLHCMDHTGQLTAMHEALSA